MIAALKYSLQYIWMLKIYKCKRIYDISNNYISGETESEYEEMDNYESYEEVLYLDKGNIAP